MKPIVYLKGDATAPQAKGIKLIAHVCNDLGGWGKGFVLAISKRWPEPEQSYRTWHRERAQNNFGLGAVQFVQVKPDIWVANMIGQHGMKTGSSGPPVRYDAIQKCLAQVTQKAKELDASVHMPRVGCGLAGGKWEKIEPLILQELSEKDVSVHVYDFGYEAANHDGTSHGIGLTPAPLASRQPFAAGEFSVVWLRGVGTHVIIKARVRLR